MEKLEKWVGKPFVKWCKADIEDTRKIYYVLHKGGLKPETFTFTSEENVDGLMMYRVRNSTIKSIKLVDEEWHIELVY